MLINDPLVPEATEADLVNASRFLLQTSTGTKQLPADIIPSKILKTIGRIGSEADAKAAFGDTPDIDNAGNNTIYVIAYITNVSNIPDNHFGTLFTYTGNTAATSSAVQIYTTSQGNIFHRIKWADTWGAWKSISKVKDDDILRTFGRIGDATEAQDAFGLSPDIDNATPNSIYAIAYSVGIANLPIASGGTLLTYTGNTSTTTSAVQMYIVVSSGAFYYRQKWGGTWTEWVETKKTFFPFYCNNETSVKAVLGNTPSTDNAPLNSVITLAYITGVSNLPEAATGFLSTYSGDSSNKFQFYYVRSNDNIYSRSKWGSSAWHDWVKVNATTIFGYISSQTSAEKYLNNTSDVANAPKNSILGINYSAGIQGLPADVDSKQGQLETIAGNLTGAAAKQTFTTKNNQVWLRSLWGGTWTEWTLVNPPLSSDKLTEVIATFEKIGACGGSFATGYSNYKDSNNVSHGVNMPENSWVQLWGRKHGITAKNFSSSGWSIKDWFASAANIAAVEANPCKVYFTLFGGGNDIEDYAGMTDLGSISDVHVGSEDTNPHTFYGDYSRLIAKLQTVGGWHTKVISFTYGQVFNAAKDATQLAYIQSIHDVKELYSNVYAIDLMDDAELNSVKVSPYYYGGHYSAIGYKKIADRLEVLVDKLVNDNPNDFADVQWIGASYDIAVWY